MKLNIFVLSIALIYFILFTAVVFAAVKLVCWITGILFCLKIYIAALVIAFILAFGASLLE